MSALLHSPGGRIKRQQRFAVVESAYIVLLPPWLMAYARRETQGNGISPKKLRRRPNLNGRRQRVATREG